MSNNNQFTQEKWNWKQSRGNNFYEHKIFTNEKVIANLDGEDSEEVKANAKLIAAAPHLLTMCILMLEDILSDAIRDNSETRQLAIDNLTAAIKAATE